MITLPDALAAENVALDLRAANFEEAITAVAGLLRHHPHVTDWEAFLKAIHSHPACRVADEAGVGLCIPHARTNAVDDLVISAARLSPELATTELACPVRYIFCIGVPQTMASDYLRIVGAIMRLLKDPGTEAALQGATTKQGFIDTLSRFEMKL